MRSPKSLFTEKVTRILGWFFTVLRITGGIKVGEEKSIYYSFVHYWGEKIFVSIPDWWGNVKKDDTLMRKASCEDLALSPH